MDKEQLDQMNRELWDLEIVSDERIPNAVTERFPALFPVIYSRHFFVVGMCSLLPLTEDEVDFLQEKEDNQHIIAFVCRQRKEQQYGVRKV